MNLRALEARGLALAPWLLGASMVAHALLVLTRTSMTMIDLRVYRAGAPELLTGHLYDWRLPEFSGDFPLPFTYPPFAALLLLPLAWLPWLAARLLWQAVSVACLWWLVSLSLRVIARDTGRGWSVPWRRRAMLATALAMWIEPVRTTLNYGQINLMLAAVLLAALVTTRPAHTGLGIGLSAGIKLTPAVAGLYLLAARRWAAAAWSAVAFALTVVLAYLAAPDQSSRYWFRLAGDSSRIGPMGSAINQSLRGALSRSSGHDVGSGLPWLVAVLAAAGLLGYALLGSLRTGDTMAGIVSVQLFGLLASPISWSHHWVWAVPAVLWLVYGPTRRTWWTRGTAAGWTLATGSFLISYLLRVQPSIWYIPRPWYLAALGWAYPACGLLTLLAIGVTLQQRGRMPYTASA